MPTTPRPDRDPAEHGGAPLPPAAFGDVALGELVLAIVAGDQRAVTIVLRRAPHAATATLGVGATRRGTPSFFFDEISHYVYAGDTALHVAAAAYRWRVVPHLLRHGADVAARNRRGAQPLHYAVDGSPGSHTWDPPAQRATVVALLAAGADPDGRDKSGVTPLHRAARTRCAAAVEALLAGGADPTIENGHGSMALDIAGRTTGRGGSGSQPAKEQQAIVLELLRGAASRRH
jgi:hypothetical protein